MRNMSQLGSEENGSAMGMQGGRIFSYDVKKNWWSRAGVPSKMPAGEPGGPDSEVFYDFGIAMRGARGTTQSSARSAIRTAIAAAFSRSAIRVFMEYKKREDGSFEKLAQRNVDFGGGLERITAAINQRLRTFSISTFSRRWRRSLRSIPHSWRRKKASARCALFSITCAHRYF